MLVARNAIEFSQGQTCNHFVVGGAAVVSQALRVHEVFPTDFTLEWPLAGVEVLVLHGVSAFSERLAADTAFILSGSSFVASDVGLCAIFARGLIVAKVAGIFAVFAMRSRVYSEIYVVVEGFFANGTD